MKNCSSREIISFNFSTCPFVNRSVELGRDAIPKHTIIAEKVSTYENKQTNEMENEKGLGKVQRAWENVSRKSFGKDVRRIEKE